MTYIVLHPSEVGAWERFTGQRIDRAQKQTPQRLTELAARMDAATGRRYERR
jgi:hypothetical protein